MKGRPAIQASRTWCIRSWWRTSWRTCAWTWWAWRRGCCTTSSKTPASPSSRCARNSARKWRAASMASPSSASWTFSRPKSARPKASARCCWPWWRISASSSSSWPTASTTCGHWGYLNAERRERIARETIEIYAPIAHRLGMGKVRGELEDLAFQYLEPDAYRGDRASHRIPPPLERGIPRRDPPDGGDRAAPRGHPGARRRPGQAPIFGVSEAAAAEDHGGPGLRPDGACASSPTR